MAKVSIKVSHDGTLAVSYGHHGKEPERETAQNGKNHSPTQCAGSSVALFKNKSSNQTHAKTTDDRDHGHCDNAHKEPTDSTIRKIVDLLKEQRAHTKKTGTDENDVESDQAMVEWQTVAMVADRVMLIVFTVLVLVVYTALFGGAPT